MSMLEQLHNLEEKYLDLEAKLSDPAVVADPDQYMKYARSHAELGEIVAVFREYKAKKKIYDDDLAAAGDTDDPELAAMARDEAAALEPVLAEYGQRLTVLLLPSDPDDDKDVILEIRAGAGGDEAALFAGVLFRMYMRYAERKGWRVEILDAGETGLGGFKEVVAQVSGPGAYAHLKFESGVHRVQRVPETESQGRIHTSTCTVAVSWPSRPAATSGRRAGSS